MNGVYINRVNAVYCINAPASRHFAATPPSKGEDQGGCSRLSEWATTSLFKGGVATKYLDAK